MHFSVFLSYPKPFLKKQEEFIQKLTAYLNSRGLEPRTLGVTDYDMDAPLNAIRRLMIDSNGLIAIAFRRNFILSGKSKPNSDNNEKENEISNKWLTSPYCQIEPAMAYQLGLPLLIMREKGVIDEGILEKGVVGIYLPEFDLDCDLNEYFQSSEFTQIICKWETCVRKVIENKSLPPILY